MFGAELRDKTPVNRRFFGFKDDDDFIFCKGKGQNQGYKSAECINETLFYPKTIQSGELGRSIQNQPFPSSSSLLFHFPFSVALFSLSSPIPVPLRQLPNTTLLINTSLLLLHSPHLLASFDSSAPTSLPSHRQ